MLYKSGRFTPVQVFIKSMASEITMGTNKAKNLSTSVEMRRKAEELLQVKTAKRPSPRTNEDTQRLVHELEVHQIELEMQNEELRQVIAERDAILEKYQELYDSAPAGYFNLDHAGIINEVNQTGAAFLRVERSVLINNRLDAFISDETRPAFHDFLDKVFAHDTKKTCEVLFVKQDHSPLFVQIEAIASETRKSCSAVVIDITERKWSEKKLAEAKLRLEALMAAVPVGISFSDDITCQHITGNPAVLKQFNISSEDNLSASALDLHAPGRKVKFFLDGREISDSELPLQRAVSENKMIPPMELKVVMPSGKHWITKASGAPVRDTQGNIIGGISVTEDITELKQAEDALKQSHERKRMILEVSFIGTFELDLLTGEGRWNSVMYELLGLKPDISPGNPELFFQFVHPDDVMKVKADWKKALENGTFDSEFRIVRTDGQEHWLAGKGRFLYDDEINGRATRFLGVNYDITARKRAEDALVLLNEELEGRVAQRTEELRFKDQAMIQQNSMAALGEMINNIAHQWRQPLNVISLIIQSIQLSYASGALTSEEMNSEIQNVMENIMHMSQTIEDFRNFFKQDKVKQEFFISEAIKLAISLVSASLESYNIKVEIKIEDDATVFGYQNEYSQVLLNLISNTCDACLEHGVPNPSIFICIAQENERSVLYVRDNCGGIPDDIIYKIFDPYFTTRGPDKGTGIGLYMSKMIIEQNMNGHLTVCNTDVGAEFRIEV